MNTFTIIACTIILGICGFNRKASADDQILVQAFKSANRARFDMHGDMALRRKRYAEEVGTIYANLRETLHHQHRQKRFIISDDLINRGTEMPSSTPSTTPSAPPLPTNPQTSPTTPTTAAATTTTAKQPTEISQWPIIKLPTFPRFPSLPTFPWGGSSRRRW